MGVDRNQTLMEGVVRRENFDSHEIKKKTPRSIKLTLTGLAQTDFHHQAKRPPRERELLGNQMKKAALMKNIFE